MPQYNVPPLPFSVKRIIMIPDKKDRGMNYVGGRESDSQVVALHENCTQIADSKEIIDIDFASLMV